MENLLIGLFAHRLLFAAEQGGYNAFMRNNLTIYQLLRLIAVTGNAIFVLWILYNGIDEGFKANIVQVVSYLGLIFLLILNSFLLFHAQSKK